MINLLYRYLLEQIKKEHLEDEINLIILSDHGMDTVTYDRIIHLENYVSNNTYKAIITGPNASIRPNICKYGFKDYCLTSNI